MEPIEIRLRPWWQTPLFVGIMAAAIPLLPWAYSKLFDEISDAQKVNRKYLHIDGNSVLVEKVANEDKYNYYINIGTKYEVNRWFEVNINGEILKIGYNFGSGVFQVKVPDLKCNKNYGANIKAEIGGVYGEGPGGTIFIQCPS